MTTDTQALWDTQDADAYRRDVRQASERVLEADAAVESARLAWRDACTRLAAAEQAVSDWTLCAEPIPPALFLQRLRVLDGAAAQAEEECREAKQILTAARARRSHLWDERRVKVRQKFQVYPLEEFARRHQEEHGPNWPHQPETAPTQPSGQNGDLSAEAPVEVAQVPADQVDAPAPPPEHWRDRPVADLDVGPKALELLTRAGLTTLGAVADRFGEGQDPAGVPRLPGVRLPRVTVDRLWHAVFNARTGDDGSPTATQEEVTATREEILDAAAQADNVPLTWGDPHDFLVYLGPGPLDRAVGVTYTPGSVRGDRMFTSPRFDFRGTVNDYHCVSVEAAAGLIADGADLKAYALEVARDLARAANQGEAPQVCGHEGCSLPAGHEGAHQFDAKPRRGRKGGGRGPR